MLSLTRPRLGDCLGNWVDVRLAAGLGILAHGDRKVTYTPDFSNVAYVELFSTLR